MKQIHRLLALAGLLLVSNTHATTVSENFATDPLANGWSIFGETNLFTWDSTNHVEDVTWDSSQPDSFLYRPLGAVLTKENDFRLAFDLELLDATGYNYSCQLAVDLFHYTDATNALYSHANGTLPNVFEFAYFPGTDLLSPSESGTLTDSNADYYFAYDNQELNPGVTYSVTISHTAGSPTVTGQILTNGVPFSTLPIVYAQSISNFQLDTLSLSCFQDDGYGDSILAHGSVGNIVVTFQPPPPILYYSGYLTNGVWAATFLSQTNWNYALERSGDLRNWTTVNPGNAGTGTNLVLLDNNPPATNAFYRIQAQRP